MRQIRRSPVLNLEELRNLLDLTDHEVRALIANNDADDFAYERSTERRPRRDHRRLSASMAEAL
jgi:hypothetical protein